MIHTFVFFNPFFLFTLFLFAFFIQPYRQCIIRAQTHPVLNVFHGVVLKYSFTVVEILPSFQLQLQFSKFKTFVLSPKIGSQFGQKKITFLRTYLAI